MCKILYDIYFIKLLLSDIFITIFSLFKKKNKANFIKDKYRTSIKSNVIYVGIHEWAGYFDIREKKIKNGTKFKCGLNFQVKRFLEEKNRSKKYLLDINITVSDLDKYPFNTKKYEESGIKVYSVSNKGLDFSGYNKIFSIVKDNPNSYVILTNSSVHCDMNSFLDNYIEYMENNKDVGMLGISYCTKIYQTFFRNNFNPHIQSFFILTTIDVLKEIVEHNGGQFPGNGITNKRLLIRLGEVRLSQIVLSLGYKLAVVDPLLGIPFKFTKKDKWDKKVGDVRLFTENPNKITPISNIKL